MNGEYLDIPVVRLRLTSKVEKLGLDVRNRLLYGVDADRMKLCCLYMREWTTLYNDEGTYARLELGFCGNLREHLKQLWQGVRLDDLKLRLDIYVNKSEQRPRQYRRLHLFGFAEHRQRCAKLGYILYQNVVF